MLDTQRQPKSVEMDRRPSWEVMPTAVALANFQIELTGHKQPTECERGKEASSWLEICKRAQFT